MKEYRSAGGERRLWFEEDEIEHIMDDELYKADLFPDSTHPSVDIESFLEMHLGVKLDLYAELEPDVLGETRFIRKSRPLVLIHRDLTSEVEGMRASSGQAGRWRATLAHEAAHVTLHRMLFEVPFEQEPLFAAGTPFTPSLLRCLKRNVSFSRVPSDWREVQANRGMASLLMPKRHFSALVRTVAGVTNANDLLAKPPVVGSNALDDLIREISSLCGVSMEAVRIRFETLGIVRHENQLALGGTVRQAPSPVQGEKD